VSRLLALLVATFFLNAPAMSAESRGLTVSLKADESEGAEIVADVRLYDNSYALVIGIDEYVAWPRLSNAVKDAKLVAAALESAGFEVTLKTNLNSAQMKSVFEEFFVFKGENPEARLFVWFAGHGHTQDGEGYLVPADAPLASGGAKFRFRSLSLRRFGEYVRQAKSKHAFAIFDSCFSGTIFETARSLPPPAITKATTAPVRQFLSSGDAGQEVSDDGTFRRMFIEAITGKRRADFNSDGYITASELGMFLSDKVTNYSNRRQTPRYGKLNDPDFDQGDFVFSLPKTRIDIPVKPKATAASRESAEAARIEQETTFWNSVKGSGKTSAYQAYIESYPNGAFVRLARAELDALRKAEERKAKEKAQRERQLARRQAATEDKRTETGPAFARSWSGKYFYSDSRAPVPFSVNLQKSGQRISGRMAEPNTFAKQPVNRLFANLSGVIRPDSVVRFTKTYDGTGGVSHSVTYSGKLTGTGRNARISGTWRVRNLSGRFTMAPR